MDDLRDLYQELILDHNQRPRNFGAMEHATCSARGHNPLCGDQLELFISLEDDVIADIRFTGSGCAISKASASIMTITVKGKTRTEAQLLLRQFSGMVIDGDPPVPELGKLVALAEIGKFPARVKCAMLAWRTLESTLAGTNVTVATE